jgi:hypothetical protein
MLNLVEKKKEKKKNSNIYIVKTKNKKWRTKIRTKTKALITILIVQHNDTRTWIVKGDNIRASYAHRLSKEMM